ncbi:hypothetical protein CEP54_005145 [Fusarium duplospermum]|uniref:Uncharacterized protein n=1 Tax=Fusarium duplospermum TaxID=1325734 RepID=A0A428QE61_9HYPO|nr:hypothetical protein CEP54_005145 [Fusarium duplospermum]
MAHTPYLTSYASTFSYAGGATRANVGGARAREHLSRALGEIDGLFAGMKYLDETETTPPDINEDGDDASELDDLLLELGAMSANAAIQTNPQSAEGIAWSSVRDVRSGMQCHWRHFVKLSQSLNIPIINELRETYEDAQGLREAGVFAFRNTLTGPAPNNLTKVFAFCSLSYVVSHLLHARGRLAEEDILAGITLWLNALEIPEERKAFQTLAQNLWPEAQNHLHYHDLGLSASDQSAIVSLQSNEFLPASSPSADPDSPGLVLESAFDPAPFSNAQDPSLILESGFDTAPLPGLSQNHLQYQDLSACNQSDIGAFQSNDFVPAVFPSTDPDSSGLVLEPGFDPEPWPGLAQNHPHYHDLGPSASNQSAIFGLQSNGFVPASFPGTDPGSSVPVLEPGFDPEPLPDLQGHSLAALGSSAAGPVAQNFPTPNTFAQEASQKHVFDITDATHNACYWQLLQHAPFDSSLTAIPQPYLDTGQGQFADTTLSTVPTEATEQSTTSGVPDDVPALISSPEELRDTLVFAVVCQYCCDSGDFWYGLSGCGMITKDRELVSAWNVECVGKKGRIHEQYLRHLTSEKDDKDVPSRGIVSIVETLVEMGYLQSIKETKDYMIEIGKATTL